MVATNTAARISAALQAKLMRLGRVTEDGVPLDTSEALSNWRGVTDGVGDLV
jgi:hypothetical protein